jgi:hypothetical protein
MPPAGFEPTMPGSERPYTNALFSDCCKFISGDGTSKMPLSSTDFPSAEKKLLITGYNLWISKTGP